MGAELERRHDGFTTGERMASRVRGHTLTAFFAALRELHGERTAFAMMAELPPRVRAATEREAEWLPLEFVVAWLEAAWEGPLARDHAALVRCVDRMMELGFGRVRRVLLAIATPQGVVRRASELWRGELSDGRMVSYSTSATSARFVLYEHPFLENQLTRDVSAEAIRYALALAGAKNARVVAGGALLEPLVLDISWG